MIFAHFDWFHWGVGNRWFLLLVAVAITLTLLFIAAHCWLRKELRKRGEW